ncbi:glycosyltransferase family protein [Flavobacterium sp. 3HN19-14]|uniref:glycosyltransferase family protein n=1 Tax=Flavobacterium sp. 3HN19-14 TaxID=3448133 RepID=UPI003EDEB729
MRILLIGEYSRLHNSLKEGLLALGHEVVLVSSGDGFKQFSSDISFEAKWCKNKIVNIPRQIIFKIFRFDVAELERGFRFWKLLKRFRSFDVVQLINESPVQTTPKLELFLLRKLFSQHKNIFVLSCGLDYNNMQFMMANPGFKSMMNPYIENPHLEKYYATPLQYLSEGQQKIHEFVLENCKGIIASDLDYVPALEGNLKFIGLIPNPVNIDKLVFKPIEIQSKIVVFLGINRWNYYPKGISYFEEAIERIAEKYKVKVTFVVAENLSYKDYIVSYEAAHILLDQVFAIDQGYNALEAMAQGKVVFTGAEKEFEAYYHIENSVNINAKPNADDLVEKLSHLIENADEIIAIGQRARHFIEKEHHYKTIAQKYTEKWSSHL